MTANDFANQIGSGVYDLEFTKKDGSLRKMRATRQFQLIPQDKHPSGSKEVTTGKGSVPVFDLDLNEWRSVIVDNIISMKEA